MGLFDIIVPKYQLLCKVHITEVKRKLQAKKSQTTQVSEPCMGGENSMSYVILDLYFYNIFIKLQNKTWQNEGEYPNRVITKD